MKRLKRLLPLLANAFSICTAVLVILDLYNPYKGYLNSAVPRCYILILCALCLLVSCLYLRMLMRGE